MGESLGNISTSELQAILGALGRGQRAGRGHSAQPPPPTATFPEFLFLWLHGVLVEEDPVQRPLVCALILFSGLARLRLGHECTPGPPAMKRALALPAFDPTGTL